MAFRLKTDKTMIAFTYFLNSCNFSDITIDSWLAYIFFSINLEKSVSPTKELPLKKRIGNFEERDWMFTGYLVLVLHFLQLVSKIFKRWAIIRIFSPAVLHNLVPAKWYWLKTQTPAICMYINSQNELAEKDWSPALAIKALLKAFQFGYTTAI